MARKVKSLVIVDKERDAGKSFQLTEMPARAAEKWAMRALSALARSGVIIPDNFAVLGMAGLAGIGLRALAGVEFADAEPLMDEMMGCVAFVPDANRPDVVRPLVESDIEEVATLLKLREAILEIHTGFSIAATLSTFRAATAATGSNTSTSPEPSA